MSFNDLVKRIIIGPPSPEEEAKAQAERLAKAPVDPIQDIYQDLNLQDRKAENNTEAAVKLLTERGTLAPHIGRDFRNGDFHIHNEAQTVIVEQVSAFSPPEQLLSGDGATGEIYDANAALDQCGKLQNLANGEAFTTTHFHNGLEQIPAATKTLKHLNSILNTSQGWGDQEMVGGNYRIQREGSTLNATYINDQGAEALLLKGNPQRMEVETSYLSSTDAHTISTEYERVTGFNLEERLKAADLRADLGFEDLVSLYAIAPLSEQDLDRSWTIPQGDPLAGPVNDNTAKAVLESATLIVESHSESTFTGESYRIEQTDSGSRLSIIDGQDTVLEARSGFIKEQQLSPETAHEILSYTQDNLVSLKAGQEIQYQNAESMQQRQETALDDAIDSLDVEPQLQPFERQSDWDAQSAVASCEASGTDIFPEADNENDDFEL